MDTRIWKVAPHALQWREARETKFRSWTVVDMKKAGTAPIRPTNL